MFTPFKRMKNLALFQRAGMLKVRFHNGPNDTVGEIDLSDWVSFGDIGLGIADYLADWGRGQAHTTRISFKKSLTKFRIFLSSLDLESTGSRLSVAEFPNNVLLMFGNWLNGNREIEHDPSKQLTKSVKAKHYNKIRNIFVLGQI